MHVYRPTLKKIEQINTLEFYEQFRIQSHCNTM